MSRICGFAAVAALLMAALYGGALSSGDTSLLETVDTVLPASLFVGGLVGAYLLARTHHLLLLTPLPWFFLACAAYFGFGPLVYHVGNEATVDLAHAFFEVDEVSLVRTNILNAFSIATICGVVSLACRRGAFFQSAESPVVADRAVARRLITLLLVIGLPVKYLIALPATFHVISDVPGSLLQLAMATSIVLFLLSYLMAKGVLRFNAWIAIFFGSEILVSFLTFSKMESLLAILMIFLGRFAARGRFRSLMVAGMVAVGLYVYLAPLVLRMREQISTGTAESQGYEARLALLSSYFFGNASSDSIVESDADRPQIWWFRLNYANAQAFVMDQFDSDQPGDSFKTIVYALVPRVVWPDKPTIAVGAKFNEMITGDDETNSAAGVFAEAYWNGGWAAVFATCIYIGLLFSFFTKQSIRSFIEGDLRWLPCVFIGIFIGGRIDDWFALTYVAAVAIALLLYLLVRRLIPLPGDARMLRPALDAV